MDKIEKKFVKLDILKDKTLKEFMKIYEDESLTDEEIKNYLKYFLREIEREFKYRLNNW